MVEFRWPDPGFLATRLWQSITHDLKDMPYYSPWTAWKPALATLIAITYALGILSYPPQTRLRRKLALVLLFVPVTYAFLHQSELAPASSVCDTFGRFLYIWLANMSYELTILEYTPSMVKENDSCRNRVREAYKVLFARAHPGWEKLDGVRTPAPYRPKHSYTKKQFLLRHAVTAVVLFVAQSMYSVLTETVIQSSHLYGYEAGIFFRRLPESLNLDELWDKFDLAIYWCIINMWMYEAYHSVFAIFFVGLGFDVPGEWSMSLFRPISNAWSVRRYWGKHWHDYIYHSFSSHTKIVTRQWLDMKPNLFRRLVENTVVFAASGVMHSAVRYMQYGDTGDHWPITFWYIGQMVPIVIEGFIQTYWASFKRSRGIRDTKWLVLVEKWIGYLWVLGFNMWSVSKYVHVRNAWGDAHWRKKYAVELAEWEAQQNKTSIIGGAAENTTEKYEL